MMLLPILLGSLASAAAAAATPPHIVFILSDDLGWNDVSFHGSEQIGTPNIDAIATEGTPLYNYHIQPVCSPTRSTILSGRHVIHTGLYMPFAQGTNLRLSLNYTLLPAFLKKIGYSTHMVRVIFPSRSVYPVEFTHSPIAPVGVSDRWASGTWARTSLRRCRRGAAST